MTISLMNAMETMMGLDIYKLKVRKLEDTYSVHQNRLHTLTVSAFDLRDNKSLSDVFEKFSEFVIKDKSEYFDIQKTAQKHNVPDDWYYSGLSMLSDDRDVMIFSNEDNTQRIEIAIEDVITCIDDCYTLYAEEVGYQRRDCVGPMFDEFFGGGEEFFGIHYTPFNEVLDVAKTYTVKGSPMETWVLADDEFVNFSF